MLILKLRSVNQQFTDLEYKTKTLTISTLSSKIQKENDCKYKKYGKDIPFILLALKSIKNLFRMKIKQRHLTFVLLGEMLYLEVTESEVLWSKVMKNLSQKSDMLLKQMVILFSSKFLKNFEKQKMKEIEIKKNISKNSQFNFRLIHSMSFNEENETKIFKNQIVLKIKELFNKILNSNYNDETLFLAILRLGSVGYFSEKIIKICLNRMIDLGLVYNLMMLFYKYETLDYIKVYMQIQNTGNSMNIFYYNYKEIIKNKYFEEHNSLLEISKINAIEGYKSQKTRSEADFSYLSNQKNKENSNLDKKNIDNQKDQFLIKSNTKSVSYTHLTLPTTPYV